MLISCPACAARYRVDPARIAGKRITIRCPGCQYVFTPTSSLASPSVPVRVLLASGNAELAQAFQALCGRAGLNARVCQDGTEAVAALEGALAEVVLLDVALTGRYAFDVIDVIRNLPGGEKVRIVLLSASFRRGSFIAKSIDLHGADASVDGDDLVAMDTESFQRFLLPLGPTSTGGEDSPEGDSGPRLSPEQWNHAANLAKVIAADIVLRYQDLLDESARTGQLAKALVEGLAQGRKLFADRVGGEVAACYDFFGAALAACLQTQERTRASDTDL